MEQEIWKPIVGYEGLYEVSNLGNVKSLQGWNGREYVSRVKVLKRSKTTTGYWKVELVKDGVKKSRKVHRLVAMAFIPNPESKPNVNHIDGNPLNSHVSNLEWCTQEENIHHAVRTGLRKTFNPDVEEVRKHYYEHRYTMQKIATLYGVSITCIKCFMEKNGMKRRNLSEVKDKYGIDMDVLQREFENGKSNMELSKKYDCPSNLIAVRRYQMKKKGLII